MSAIPDPQPDMLAAALQYAEEGIPVIPLHEPVGTEGGCTCNGGQPCKANPPSPGKHPRTRRGVKDATTDPEQITAWWRRWPTANLGGAMGEGADQWVLDVDGPDGEASLTTQPPLPETRTSRTGRVDGGRHLFFRMPPGVAIGNRAHALPGLDVRGTGGYVVLPPSRHPSGARYTFEDDARPAAAPDWLLSLVAKRSPSKASKPATPATAEPALPLGAQGSQPAAQDIVGAVWASGEGGGGGDPRIRVLGMVRAACARIRSAPEGARNDTVNRECYSLGGFLDSAGLTVDDIAPELEAAARDAEQDPRQVRRQVEDGRAVPRQLPQDTPRANREHTLPPDEPDAPSEAQEAAEGGAAGGGSSERPRVVLGPRVDQVLAAAAATLRQAPVLYARGEPPEIVAVDKALISPVGPDRLVPMLSELADYGRMKIDAKKARLRFVPEPPPYPLAKQMLARGLHPELRRLDGVTRSPVLRADGSIVTTPGYDTESRVVYVPEGPPPVVVRDPTRDDARRAVATLLDVVDEVPFARPVDASVWLALVLTLACRMNIRGPVPCFGSFANQAGTGKTRLFQLAGLIAHGVMVSATTWPAKFGAPDEEEQRKKVDAAVLAGKPFVIWDNIRGPAAGTALEAAITTWMYELRILGGSKMPTVVQLTTFALTMNGAQLAGDMPRRTLPCRLFWPGPNPEERSFRRPDIQAYVEGRRGVLHAAALTIVSAYLRAGAPVTDLPPWGSFEAWSALVRQALVWAGQPDPYTARDGLGTMDQSGAAHDRMIAFIAATMPTEWRVGELASQFERGDTSGPPYDIGGGWTAQDARDLAAELGVWDRTARCCKREALGRLVRGVTGRPAADGRRLETVLRPDGQEKKHRTGVCFYTVIGTEPKASPGPASHG